nr:hypothetical protein [Acidobacteriota bacterium]
MPSPVVCLPMIVPVRSAPVGRAARPRPFTEGYRSRGARVRQTAPARHRPPVALCAGRPPAVKASRRHRDGGPLRHGVIQSLLAGALLAIGLSGSGCASIAAGPLD